MMKFLVFVAVLAVCAFAVPSNVAHPLKELAKINFHKKFGSEVFTPHQLPCSYAIFMDCETTDPSTNETGQIKQDFYVDGEIQIFSLTESMENPKFFEQDITRMDLPYDQGSQTLVPVYYAQTSLGCGSNSKEKGEAQDEINSLLGIFTDKQAYQNVSDSEFKGKKCKMYWTHSDDSDVRVYVDDDDYIIGLSYSDPDYSTVMAITYDFNISMDSFTIDRSQFPNCDQKAYNPPVDQCK